MTADADKHRVSARTLENRRLADIAFLEELRTANASQLRELERNCAHKTAPKWKQIAIARAVARISLRE